MHYGCSRRSPDYTAPPLPAGQGAATVVPVAAAANFLVRQHCMQRPADGSSPSSQEPLAALRQRCGAQSLAPLGG